MSARPVLVLPASLRRLICALPALIAGALIASLGPAAHGAEPVPPSTTEIKAAVTKSLPLLANAARVSKEERGRCFTCHNQGLPIMAMSIAAERGFEIDRDTLRDQVQFTADFLAKNRANYLQGKGQGGQADTAGYALWALEHGKWKPDETTAAVAEYLLGFQKDLVHWKPQSRRPPTEQSLFTSTHVALKGLKTFGTAEQKERIVQRTEQVREWLLETPAEDNEDRVARLRALRVAGAAPHEIGNAVQALLHAQRADGGWAQLPGLESDVYATATALAALHQAGDLPVEDRTYVNGVRYLLSAQLPDGSWHVKSRSKPIQVFYDGGYPHEKDQFISVSAAGWATIALALAAAK
jgi:hypothetical protein